MRVEDESGMLKSVKIIHALVDQEIKAGIDSDHMYVLHEKKVLELMVRSVVAGFSQGCAMSLLSGLMYPKQLGAIVGLSGYLPLRQKLTQLQTEANRTTPVWLGHGTADPVVNFKYGQMTAKVLKEAGMNVSWNTYPGVGHTADPKEIQDLASFLTSLKL